MDDQHGLWAKPRQVEHLGLTQQIPDAHLDEFGGGTVENDILRRMKRQPNIEGSGLGTEGR